MRRLVLAAMAVTAAVAATAAMATAAEDAWRTRSIAAEALKSTSAYTRLERLTDTIGARLAGSEAEPRAVAWAREEFEKDGVAVRLEPVMVPVWIRGTESAAMVAPFPQPLSMLGLGGSVGTPAEGITAPVVVVSSKEELLALGEAKVRGKIVLYDHPFVRTGDEMADYGKAVTYRGSGASEAARLGAVASLIRSVGTSSLRTPHTGSLRYATDAPRIPGAALAIEDAMLLRRLSVAGHEPVVRLIMSARSDPDREGANVVAEIKGRERPEEIVVVGAHLDSWDVGTGAIDDGAGCVMVLETMRLIAGGPAPRRTVRAVLYANEENGLRGGRGYKAAHLEEMTRHVAAIEADSGAGRATGINLKAGEGGVDKLRAMMTPALAGLGATVFKEGGGGADIGVLGRAGVPIMGLLQDTTRYFDWHHTMADTLDKVEPRELQQATAVLAAAVWSLADAAEPLPRGAVEADPAAEGAGSARPAAPAKPPEPAKNGRSNSGP